MEKVNLVLLTGLLSSREIFQYQVEQLQDIANIQVIELNDADSPSAMTDKILKLAPMHFMLAGHSIGGWVALRVMKIAPNRVTKLCIISTAARGIDPNEYALRQTVLDRIKTGEFHTIASEIADKFIFNKSVRNSVLDMFLQQGEQALINQTRAMMIREDLRDILPTITCPTYVLHAEHDQRFSLAMLQEVANLIPNATFKIIQGSGHMSPMEAPEALSDLLREWIKS